MIGKKTILLRKYLKTEASKIEKSYRSCHVMKAIFILTQITIFWSQPAITCSKLTIETLEQSVKYVWRRSAVFIVNFEHISHFHTLF